MQKVIDITSSEQEEFIPLPCYVWDERPETVPLTFDECSTAIHLDNGDLAQASVRLRVSIHRLNRFVRGSPRLQRVLAEAYDVVIVKAVSVPIQALFDPNANDRRKEWASTKILATRAAQGHPLSPAPASTTTNIGTSAAFRVVWGNNEVIAEIGPAGADVDSGPVREE